MHVLTLTKTTIHVHQLVKDNFVALVSYMFDGVYDQKHEVGRQT